MTNEILELIKEAVKKQDEIENGINREQIKTIYEVVWNDVIKQFKDDLFGNEEYYYTIINRSTILFKYLLVTDKMVLLKKLVADGFCIIDDDNLTTALIARDKIISYGREKKKVK